MTKRRFHDGCSWALTLGGSTTTYNTTEDLDWALYNLFKEGKLDKKTSGRIFYSLNPQEIAERHIDEIKQDVGTNAITVTFHDADGEPESYQVIPNSIGVNKFITTVPINDGKSLLPEFDQELWKQNQIHAYLNRGYTETGQLIPITYPNGDEIQLDGTREQAEKLVENQIKSWPILTEYGTAIHKILEDTFNEKIPTKASCLSDNVYDSVCNQALALKKKLQEKYVGCKFYTELGIKSKELSPEIMQQLQLLGLDSINGKIDLLVLDASGKAHIFDFKVSRKPVASPGRSNNSEWDQQSNMVTRSTNTWHSSKKNGASYQVGFYDEMVSAYGIDVDGTTIIPILLDLQYDENDKFQPKDITNVVIQTNDEGINDWVRNPHAKSNIRRKVKECFKTEITPSSEEIQQLENVHSQFFPKNSTQVARTANKSNRDAYKKDDKIVHKLKTGEFRPSSNPNANYRLRFPGTNLKSKYCRTEEEVNAALDEYINKLHSAASDDWNRIATIINDIRNDSTKIDDLTTYNPNQAAFVKTQFERYADSSWTFNEVPELNDIGIFIFTKGAKSEIVVLSKEHLRSTINLGLGDKLLGKTKPNKYVQQNILDATLGNIEIMKAAIYVAQHKEFFNKHKIAAIRAINPDFGLETRLMNSDIITNFNALVNENRSVRIGKLDSNLFMEDRQAMVFGAEERLSSLQVLIDGHMNGNEQAYTEQWFLSVIEDFKHTYRTELDERNKFKNNPYWHALTYLENGLAAVKGLRSTIETDKADYINGKFVELNGLMISSSQYSPSANIRQLGSIIDDFTKEVQQTVAKIGYPMIPKFKALYDKYGTNSHIFESWFADKKKLILKDPESPEFDGDPISRDALKTFLEIVAKLKNPHIKTEADLENAKQDPSYYELPLLEAVTSRQLQHLGLLKTIKNKWREKSALAENLWMEEDIKSGNWSSNEGKMYNQFDLTSSAREARITDNGFGMFETDIERVFNAVLVAYCRSNISKKYIPYISALKLGLEYSDYYGGSGDNKDRGDNMRNIRDKFDKIVRSKFYGDTIMDSTGVKRVAKFVSFIKSIFSTLTLSLNTRSFLRETLQGIYTGVSRTGVKILPGVSEKNYLDALTYVIQECPKSFSGVSMLQQLNATYGMANQSLSQLAQQRRLNWAKIRRWGPDTLFITATSPDFLHRMGILVAKMKADNCWDAHSCSENGQLTYTFKNDKRFTAFINDDFSNPDYIKQKSLYLTMIDEFNREGFRNEDGSLLNADNKDALPQAYTKKEGESIKNYADLLYGHYDEESKSLLCDTLFGSIFLQYKTYITAKLEQWLMKEGVYNTEQLKQQFDSVTGQPLYQKFYEDENGIAQRDIILESEYNNLSEEEKKACRLYYDYEGIPMHGMLQESLALLKAVAPWTDEKVKEIWADPARRAILKLAFHDLCLTSLMIFIVQFIFKGITDTDEMSYNKIARAVKQMGPGTNLAYNVMVGSLQDFQITKLVGSMTDTPPTALALQRLARSSWNVITGDSSMTYWLTQNIGALRDFQGIVSQIDK